MKGNMLDLAIGVVLGVAFGAVINSIVKDLLTPIIGMVTGGVDFSARSATINGVALNYGLFLNALLNFVLVAFALFMIVKTINRFRRDTPVVEVAPEPTQTEILLTEIRDALRGNKAVVATAVTETEKV